MQKEIESFVCIRVLIVKMMINYKHNHQPNLIVIIIFIGPESDHWECLSVTDSLTN